MTPEHVVQFTTQPTREGQVAFILLIVGACTVLRWLVQGALVILAGLASCLWVGIVLTARAFLWIEAEHDRRMQRVRAYETRTPA